MLKLLDFAQTLMWLVVIVSGPTTLYWDTQLGISLLGNSLFVLLLLKIAEYFVKKSANKKTEAFIASVDPSSPQAQAINDFVVMKRRMEVLERASKGKMAADEVMRQLEVVEENVPFPQPEKTVAPPKPKADLKYDALGYAEQRAVKAICFLPQHPLIYGKAILEKYPCWIGGKPKVPQGFIWPRNEADEALHFLAQFDCASLPREVADPCFLPKTGTVYIFTVLDGEFTEINYNDDSSIVIYRPEFGPDLKEMSPPAETRPVYFHGEDVLTAFSNLDIPETAYQSLQSLPKLPLKPVVFMSYPALSDLKETYHFDSDLSPQEVEDIRMKIATLNTKSLIEALGVNVQKLQRRQESFFNSVFVTHEGASVPTALLKSLGNVYLEELRSKGGYDRQDVPQDDGYFQFLALKSLNEKLNTLSPWLPCPRTELEACQNLFLQIDKEAKTRAQTDAAFLERFKRATTGEMRRDLLLAAITPPEAPLSEELQWLFTDHFLPLDFHKGEPQTAQNIHQLGGYSPWVQTALPGINCGGNTLLRFGNEESCGLELGDNGTLFAFVQLENNRLNWQKSGTLQECT